MTRRRRACEISNNSRDVTGKALKTEDDYGWADFDFAATLEEDQAVCSRAARSCCSMVGGQVIAGIDAALAAATGSEIGDDDDNKRWHEELKAEVSACREVEALSSV